MKEKEKQQRQKKLETEIQETITKEKLQTSNEIKKGKTKYSDGEIYKTLTTLTKQNKINRQKIGNKYYYWKK